MPHNKGYKILSFRDKHGEMYKVECGGGYTNKFNGCLVTYSLDIMLDYIDDFLHIYSVKRLEDGLVFKISNYPIFGNEISKITLDTKTDNILVFITGTIRPLIIEK